MQVFRHSTAILGESPFWFEGALWWCDITAGLIHRSAPGDPEDGSRDATIELTAPVASFHPADGGGFVVSLGDRVVLVDAAGEVTRTLAVIDHRQDGLRLNEGKVDPAGRWVTGSMDLIGDDPVAAFYAVGEEAVEIASGLITANGVEFTPDGRRIWFTDTGVKTIYTATYSETGMIGEPEVFHRGVMHDGLALAIDGTLFGGVYGEGRVIRLSADGTELESYELPAPNVTGVAFGDDRLYVTSARENLTEDQLVRFPLSGSVFSLDVGTTGYPVRMFSPAR